MKTSILISAAILAATAVIFVREPSLSSMLLGGLGALIWTFQRRKRIFVH